MILDTNDIVYVCLCLHFALRLKTHAKHVLKNIYFEVKNILV